MFSLNKSRKDNLKSSQGDLESQNRHEKDHVRQLKEWGKIPNNFYLRLFNLIEYECDSNLETLGNLRSDLFFLLIFSWQGKSYII